MIGSIKYIWQANGRAKQVSGSRLPIKAILAVHALPNLQKWESPTPSFIGDVAYMILRRRTLEIERGTLLIFVLTTVSGNILYIHALQLSVVARFSKYFKMLT